MIFARLVFFCCVSIVLVSCGGPSFEEATAYNERIKEKHRLLGEALVVHGQLLERSTVDEKAVDEGLFRRGEEILFHYVDSLGSSESVRRLPLPSESLRDLHNQFADTVFYLTESVRVVDEGAYSFSSIMAAESLWLEARQGYLDFTSQLLTLTGKEDQVLAPKQEDHTPSVGKLSVFPEE